MMCYWRRATANGVLAAMGVGFGVLLSFYVIGWIHNWSLALGSDATGWALWIQQSLGPDLMIGTATAFRPYFVFGVDPVLWAMLASAIAGVGVSFVTRPPSEAHLQRVYDGPRRATSTTAAATA